MGVRLLVVVLLIGACANPAPPPPPPPPQGPVPLVDQIIPPTQAELPIRLRTQRQIEEDLGLPIGSLLQDRPPIVLQPGDEIDVIVGGFPEFSGARSVLPDGMILVEEQRAESAGGRRFRQAIPAADRTVVEVEQEISDLLGRYLRHQGVQIAVRALTPRQITLVAGEPRSGPVAITGSGTLLETLTAAEWNPRAHQGRQVAIVRDGRTTTIDLRQILEFGQNDINLRLQHGDILLMLESLPIRVTGAVREPGAFPLPLPGRIDLRTAVFMAGGIGENADLAQASVLRSNGELLQIDLNRYLFDRPAEPVILEGGDSIHIPESRNLGIFVFGMVNRGGQVQLPYGSRLSHAIALADPRQFGAKLSQVIVIRHWQNNPTPQIWHVDAEQLLYDPDPALDLALEPGDVVYIPETLTSDIVDVASRILAPLTTGINTTLSGYLGEIAVRSARHNFYDSRAASDE